MRKKLKHQFKQIFNKDEGNTYFSPGRVNLIGEHIDYNGGSVLPTAISFGSYGVAAKRDDDLIRIYSQGFSSEIHTLKIGTYKKDNDHQWMDYIKGVLAIFASEGIHLKVGFDLYIESDLPIGAGLSSSASIELLIATIINTEYHLNLSRKTLVSIGKKVENEFIGVNSGIMDQFAVAFGKKNQAILLNTETLDFQHIPLHLAPYQLVIINTNKKRTLADSKYNERYMECQEALSILKSRYQVKHLCAVTLTELEVAKQFLPKTIYQRAKHVITEQQRTLDAVDALKQNDIKRFGQLLNASHRSLRDDYEVTGIELDTLVEAAQTAGALGARMTGAGFGGCVVALIHQEQIDQFVESVQKTYTVKIGYAPSFYPVEAVDGSGLL